MAKETMASGMDVARYATPYFARRSFADCPPSFFWRDWNSPASRPYDSVVSSTDNIFLSCVVVVDDDGGGDDADFSLVSKALRALLKVLGGDDAAFIWWCSDVCGSAVDCAPIRLNDDGDVGVQE